MTAYAVSFGGDAMAYAVASAPPSLSVPGAPGSVASLPEAPAAPAVQRSWGMAAVVTGVPLVVAVGCGVLTLAYPSLKRVWEVAGSVSTVVAAAAAVVTLVSMFGRGRGTGPWR
ncbi:hypothetical protein [Streptomyces lydicus]|nr:hypothetical protein [Streptomyces lydicus]